MSENVWIQRAWEYMLDIRLLPAMDLDLLETATTTTKATTLNYFMDDQDLLSTDEDYVDPFQIPPWPVALFLSKAFFNSLQGAFYFRDERCFLRQLENLYSSESVGTKSTWPQRNFLPLPTLPGRLVLSGLR